jgi:hypothetical protein
MSSFPLNRNNKPNLKALSIADAYADVLALVIKSQFCEPAAKDPASIPIDFTIGKGLSLGRSLDSNIKSIQEILSSIESICLKFKTLEVSINDNNREQIVQDMNRIDLQFKENQNKLRIILGAKFNNIPLFPKAGKTVSIKLRHQRNDCYSLDLPDLEQIFNPIFNIPDIETLSLEVQQDHKHVKILTIDSIKNTILKISEEILKQIEDLSKASAEYYLIRKANRQASRSVSNLTEAKIQLKNIQSFMQERPKLITANQANADKIKIIKARRFKDAI